MLPELLLQELSYVVWRTGITNAPGEIAVRLRKMTAEPKSPAVSFELWLGHAPKAPKAARRPGHIGPQRSPR
jgi:hypothetical protein